MAFTLCPYRTKNTIRRKYTCITAEESEEPHDKVLEVETVEYMPCEAEKCPFYSSWGNVCLRVEHEVKGKDKD